MARVLVVDVLETRTVYEAQVNDLNDYYRELRCSVFDVVNRKVGDKFFDIYVDDNGLFVKEPRPSFFGKALFSSTYEPMLVGNLLFANHDKEGNTTDLSDEDIEMIKSRIVEVKFKDGIKCPVILCEPDI